MKQYLTQIALGRIVLHLGCVCRGGQWGYHLTAVRREIQGFFVNPGVVQRSRSRH